MKNAIKLTACDTEAWWDKYGKVIEAEIREMQDSGLPDSDASWQKMQDLREDYFIHSREKFLADQGAVEKNHIEITLEEINKMTNNKYHLCWGELYATQMKDSYFDEIPFPSAQAVEIAHLEDFSVFPKIKPQKRFWKNRLSPEPLYIDYFKRETNGVLKFGKYVSINSTWRDIIPAIVDVCEASGDYHHCFLENLRLSDDGKVIHIECGS